MALGAADLSPVAAVEPVAEREASTCLMLVQSGLPALVVKNASLYWSSTVVYDVDLVLTIKEIGTPLLCTMGPAE